MIVLQSARVCAVALAALVMVSGLTPNHALAAERSDSGAGSSVMVPTTMAGNATGYADLVDLLELAPLALAVQVRKVVQVEPERAKDIPAGWARIYIEARGLVALRGILPPVETLSYLADVRLDGRGKLPALNKRNLLLLARPVAGHPEMVQLVAPDAQLPWDPALEMRVRAVLGALRAADAPSPVTRVREAMYVPGTLVGEGETQIFLATANGSPAAISVLHQSGPMLNRPASWSVSFSEVVDASGKPPARDTLAWYRLACFLPRELPAGVNVSASPQDRAQAVNDYHLVIAGLGPCGRRR